MNTGRLLQSGFGLRCATTIITPQVAGPYGSGTWFTDDLQLHTLSMGETSLSCPQTALRCLPNRTAHTTCSRGRVLAGTKRYGATFPGGFMSRRD
jgi:hypothetical protein